MSLYLCTMFIPLDIYAILKISKVEKIVAINFILAI